MPPGTEGGGGIKPGREGVQLDIDISDVSCTKATIDRTVEPVATEFPVAALTEPRV
jgi:hypothetical protein